MAGNIVASHSEPASLHQNPVMHTNSTGYSPLEVATAVTFLVGIYQVRSHYFCLKTLLIFKIPLLFIIIIFEFFFSFEVHLTLPYVPQVIMYIFQLGIICTLLSETLVSGLTAGAAIHVLTSQLKDVLGLKLNQINGPFKLIYVRTHSISSIRKAQTV